MIRIVPFKPEDSSRWDSYVKNHPEANLYHLSFFKTVVQNTYRHSGFYFLALDENSEIRGILPLFFFRSLIFGKELISLPFCDYGGILADTPEVSISLFKKAKELMSSLGCKALELRQISKQPFPFDTSISPDGNLSVISSKVRMFLDLPESPDILFSSFSPKLRSQIRKPQKEGCICLNGGLELIDDFYDVFVYNMRDLGSPVHSKQLIINMLTEYPQSSRLFVVYYLQKPIAGSLIAGVNNILVNPWASFKRSHQKIAPNMLLYWEMLSFAIKNGYRSFDFGRSTPDEGTYKFKAQWGASPQQLHWYKYAAQTETSDNFSSKRGSFIKIWSRLPPGITRVIGPLLRKHIHL